MLYRIFIFLAFCFSIVFEAQAQKTPVKKNQVKNEEYLFQPLLIRGQKQSVRKSKDMKKQGKNIIGSEVFFLDIDFKKRIFE